MFSASLVAAETAGRKLVAPHGPDHALVPAYERFFAAKKSNLGEPGRLFLHQCVTAFRGQLLPETVAILRQHFGPRVCGLAAKSLQEQLQAHAPRLEQKRAELAAARTRLQALAAPLQKLAAATKGLVPKLAELGRAFDHEVAQLPGKQVVLQPQAKPGPRDARPAAQPNPASGRRP